MATICNSTEQHRQCQYKNVSNLNESKSVKVVFLLLARSAKSKTPTHSESPDREKDQPLVFVKSKVEDYKVSSVVDLDSVRSLGKTIASSELFGKMTAAAGEIVALSVVRNGLDIVKFSQEFDYMNKKFSMKSQTMLARLVDAGGSYQIIERTSEAAEITVSLDGRLFTERLTWEEAKLEPFVYAGKDSDNAALLLAGNTDELRVSSNYATPRRRSQHLWARVVSDSIRVVAPHLLAGAYTPEEVSGFTGQPSTDAAAYVEEPQPEVVKQVVSEPPAEKQAVPASGEAMPREPVPEQPCSTEMADAIRAAIKEFGQREGTEALQKLMLRLEERGVKNAAQLQHQYAKQLLIVLNSTDKSLLKPFFTEVYPAPSVEQAT